MTFQSLRILSKTMTLRFMMMMIILLLSMHHRTTSFHVDGMVIVPKKATLTTTKMSNMKLYNQNHKSSDRAYIERTLEDMMGDDWREFRAKLVYQEQLHQQQSQSGSSSSSLVPLFLSNATSSSSSLTGSTTSDQPTDSKLLKQGQLGDLFVGAINSIFHHNHNVNKQKQTIEQQEQVQHNIFDGDNIGGISYDAKTTSKQTMNHQYYNDDPFVSHDEIPALLHPTSYKINKHRWAHSIPHPEAGCVLIANEKLGGIFHQTIVLIIQHCDKVGSTGVVINRPLDGDLLKIVSGQTSSKIDLSLKLAFASSPVTYGGPVLSDEYSILHGFGQVEGSTKLCPGVYIGGSEELMNEVRIRRLDPLKCLFVQGHAAWVPGQLSKEISKGVWYTAAVSSDFILRYAGAKITDDDNPHDLWADILSCMGGTYANIAQTHQGRGDMRMP